MVNMYGDNIFTEKLRPAVKEMLTDKRFYGPPEEREEITRTAITEIPLFTRPLREMSVMDLRTTVPSLMKLVRNGYPGWGKDARRPTWWPQDVPFINPRQRPQHMIGKYWLSRV